MSHDQNSKTCETICYTMSGLSGIALSVGLSGAMPNILAVIIGVGFGGFMAAFLQTRVCGLALDYWGPFEGLRAFIKEEEPDPTDTHSDTASSSGS